MEHSIVTVQRQVRKPVSSGSTRCILFCKPRTLNRSNGTPSKLTVFPRTAALHSTQEDENFTMSSDEGDQAELEEKTRLINQVLELQHTLEDLSSRVDAVKEENLKLKSENQVLGQYIENLMSASSVFQTTETKGK
ncbi:short coiled-coil protein B-like isoform X1 [Paralichthys olivaceus]|uniref:short coiled-coil protein B-like isoform X1 n=2 Tax=Paralichthys olivaceus TaxID=8255 RepID=UPI0037502098